ncbi:spore coat U domain-containing protein [uncultured Phyllobacterium sp.]|uniref:Csu type fimbrial protein n=1 Tax=uncultured Phyllobacterium sp. TaxID=253813 RepID=UPI0025839DBD|nr:spore coat U domain-containing protein [uncultured Phyllobacterium sp.]
MKIVIPTFALSALIASSVSCWSSSIAPGNLEVNVELRAECSVDVGGGVLDFGNHDRVNEDIKIQGSIQVQCNNLTRYSISLNNGRNYNNEGTENLDTGRKMKSDSGSLIAYELYTDAGYNTIWGETEEKTTVTARVPRPPTFDPRRIQESYINENSINKRRSVSVKESADGRVQSIPIYGRVLKSDALSALPGRYSDTVTVTVSY